MQNEWKEVTLGDLGEVNRGRSRHRPRYAEHLYGGPYPFIQTGDIRESGGRIIKHNQTYSEEGLKQSRLWPEGTMCITIAANIAETAILTYPACFPDSVVGFIADQDKCDVKFIEYTFRNLKRRLQAEATGSVQDNINLGTLSRLYFKIPPLPEQKAIAHILGSLDDKIELNRKVNETLEAMAQALFKSWFVDFDPVIDNALAAGKMIPAELQAKAEVRKKKLEEKYGSLASARQALADSIFPSEFAETEELGPIPKGWKVKMVGNLIDTISKTYSLKSVSKVIFLNTGDIKEGKFLHNSMSAASSLPGQAKKSIQKGDILYSEIRPQNKRFAFVHFDSSGYVVSTKLMVLRSKGEVDSLFTYFLLKQQDKIDYLQMMAESRSGTFPQITFDVLSKIQIVMPEANILDNFIELSLRPIFEKSLSKDKENVSLSKLRDTLLPKLLSGELRIKDAEKMVEDAI